MTSSISLQHKTASHWNVTTPTFLTHSDEIRHEGANLGLSPQAKFCKKNRLKGYTLFGQLYTKN